MATPEENTDMDEFLPGELLYDLRLLRENIQIIRSYMTWGSKVLINIRPYYPKWVYRIGKPWIALNHEEAFLFFYALSLTLNFTIMAIGFALKFATPKASIDWELPQFVVEAFLFVLTFLIILYPRYKCYFLIYFWVCCKAFYWSSHCYGIAVHVDPLWRLIIGPGYVVFDLYVTTAILCHSLIDFARVDYTFAVLEEILKEEVKITEALVVRERLGEDFFTDV